MKKYNFLFLMALVFGFSACEPEIDDKSDLGPLPTPSFEILSGDGPNNFVFKNTTEGAFLTNWDLGSAGIATGEESSADFPFKGDYEITMTTFNRGGSASITKTLTVDTDDPDACQGNFKILTGCDEKIWVLAPEAGAMNVGETVDQTWWANSDDDVNVRACHFNDQYIFRSTGEFEFRTQGDIWIDTDADGNVWPPEMMLPAGCANTDQLPESLAVWGDGLHEFNITDNSLTVNGEGAWMGLYKVGTSGEVGSPQSSVSLTIRSLTEDRMVLVADYGGVVWRLTFVAQ